MTTINDITVRALKMHKADGIRHWEFECLNCGYRLAEVMVNQARFDYGCPRCGCSFEQFTYRKREEALEDEGA